MGSPATETVELKIARGVAWVVLNRPDALNAWTPQLGEELSAALHQAAEDCTVRAIVLTGAGRAFSAGADLKALEAGGGGVEGGGVEGGGALDGAGSPDVLSALRAVYNPLILRVRTLEKPVIAAVNGPAVGIGCSLALAADLIVAAESAYFLLAFANIGLGLDGGASLTLANRVGHTRAFEIAYLGERIQAAQALHWGLINRMVPDAELEPAVAALAARLAAGPPRSYASIKQTINHRLYAGFDELLDLEAVLQQECAESADFAEGALAFTQKRKAVFMG